MHRGVFGKWLQETVIYELAAAHSVNGFPYLPMYYGADTSGEKRAEDYFNGSKSMDEVTKVINNRVQLYLDEGK